MRLSKEIAKRIVVGTVLISLGKAAAQSPDLMNAIRNDNVFTPPEPMICPIDAEPIDGIGQAGEPPSGLTQNGEICTFK